MSLKLFGIVLEDLTKNIKAEEKLILAVLAATADATGQGSMLPASRLAVSAVCSKGAARKAVDYLKGERVLMIDRPAGAWGRSGRFYLDITRALEIHAEKPTGGRRVLDGGIE